MQKRWLILFSTSIIFSGIEFNFNNGVVCVKTLLPSNSKDMLIPSFF